LLAAMPEMGADAAAATVADIADIVEGF